MSSWLTKILSPSVTKAVAKNLPAVMRSNLPVSRGPLSPMQKKRLANAAAIYAAAAGCFFVAAIMFLLHGRWFSALMVLFIAACFLGYAAHFSRADTE